MADQHDLARQLLRLAQDDQVAAVALRDVAAVSDAIIGVQIEGCRRAIADLRDGWVWASRYGPRPTPIQAVFLAVVLALGSVVCFALWWFGFRGCGTIDDCGRVAETRLAQPRGHAIGERAVS